jgi:hypothetical protein
MNARRDLRLLIAELAVPLLLLGAAEMGLRCYVNRGPKPILPRLFPFPVATAKYLAYRDLAERPEPLDVLLMGMSPMMRVNASILGQALGERIGRRVDVFNFAAPLQTADFNLRLLRDVLSKLQPPRVIVYGVMPINLLHSEQPRMTDGYVQMSPAFAASDGTLSARVYATLLDHVALVRYRDLIRDRARAPFAPPDFVQGMADAADARGDIPFEAPDAPVKALTPWEHDYVREFKNFDQLMRTSLFFDHLTILARWCREHGIGFVLLNNAVHPLFLQLLPHGRADYDRFVFRLRNVATEANVPFCDPADGGVGAPELFQDTHHHNVRGSHWLTERLVDFLIRERVVDR